MNELESKILQIYCKHNFNWLCGYIPLPSTVIQSELNVSLYKVRKAIKTLKDEGYLKSETYVDKNDYGNIIVRGYIITEQAKETEIYKQCERDEDNFIKELYASEE